MENKTGNLFTDDTPRYEHHSKYLHTPDGNDPSAICIQLKARHFVTCPYNDAGFVCVEEECYGCECFDVVNSKDHVIHCNGIYGKWDRQHLHVNKNEILKNAMELIGDDSE